MRWIFRIFVALLALVVVAVGLLFLLPTERIGQIASDQLERSTGRKLTLSGDFMPTLFPTLGVKTGAITISNADWASDPVMIEASGVLVGVGLAALFGGELDIQKLRLADPVIRLERSSDGRVNWDLAPSGQSDGGGSVSGTVLREFSLATGEIVNGRVLFQDHETGQSIDFANINATLSVPKNATSASLSGSAAWQGRQASMSAEIADWRALMAGTVTAVDTRASVAGVSAQLAGLLGIGSGALPTLDGTAAISLADMAELQALLGLPALLDPLAGIRDVMVEGQLLLSDAGMFFAGDATLVLNGLPVAGKLELTGAERWLETLNIETTADITAGDALTLAFGGVVNGSKTTARGTLDLHSGNPRKLLTALEISAGLPQGTFNSAALSGNLSVDDAGTVTLEKTRLVIDKNLLNGRVSITTGGKPFVIATLRSKSLDLSAFTSDAGSGGSGSAPGWSKQPIALRGLDAVDADIRLQADAVNLGVSQLGLTDIEAKLRSGVLTLRLKDVRAYRGAMAGTVTLRGGNRIAFDSDVVARDMQLEPLLGQLLGVDRLTGTGTTRLKLSGSGGSIHQVMNSLSGSGDINFADGAFRGIDLAAMMRNLKSAFGGFEGATEFTSMTGSFTMTKGVLDNVDLALVSPLFKAGGKGQVNVGGQAMNYVVTPSTLTGDAEFSVPVIITGPWHNLKFRPDLEKLIDLLLDARLEDNEQIRKAKEKLKNPEAGLKKKVKKKLAKELGVADTSGEAEAGQGVEDKTEDELEGLLKKLFD